MRQLNKLPEKGYHDEVIHVYRTRDKLIHTIVSSNVDTQALAKVSKAKILANLYLEGAPAKISNTTFVELCDWLWSEIQSTQPNLQFSWCKRYHNAAEMFSNLQQVHLWVSVENFDITWSLNPIYNFIFQEMHNDDDYLSKSDFSLKREILAYNTTAKRAPSLEIQKILYSESVLRSAAQLFLGHAPIFKIVFP
jgi:hypothetical protein